MMRKWEFTYANNVGLTSLSVIASTDIYTAIHTWQAIVQLPLVSITNINEVKEAIEGE